MTLDIRNTRTHITIPKGLLKDLDECAQSCYMSRSEFIRLAIMEKIGRKQLADEETEDIMSLFEFKADETEE